MTGPRTRTANQARLVRCSAGCGRLVWLSGALPVAADLEYVCPSCTEFRAATGGLPVCGAVDSITEAVCTERGVHRQHVATYQDGEVRWAEPKPVAS